MCVVSIDLGDYILFCISIINVNSNKFNCWLKWMMYNFLIVVI